MSGGRPSCSVISDLKRAACHAAHVNVPCYPELIETTHFQKVAP